MKKFYTGNTVILTKGFEQVIYPTSNDENRAVIRFEKYEVFRIIDISVSWVILESGKGRYMFSNETMQEYFDIKDN
jgi:hypothetical protein